MIAVNFTAATMRALSTSLARMSDLLSATLGGTVQLRTVLAAPALTAVNVRVS
ncbi:MAG: hypothetical protein ACXU9C_03430 [Xanthobacteraceae bacterium]